MFNTRFDTQGMSKEEVAEKVIKDLGIQQTPLVMLYLSNLFVHLEVTSLLHDEIDVLQDENAGLREDLASQHDIAVSQSYDLKKANAELAALKLEKNPINWVQLCGWFPHDRLAMIQELKRTHNLTPNEAKVLVDKNVFQKTIKFPLSQQDTTTWEYSPTFEAKSAKITVKSANDVLELN